MSSVVEGVEALPQASRDDQSSVVEGGEASPQASREHERKEQEHDSSSARVRHLKWDKNVSACF